MKIPVYTEFASRALKLLQNSSVLLVRYEDLCKNHTEKVKEICNFLEIFYEENMLKFRSVQEHTLMGNRMRFDKGEIIKENTEWIHELDDDKLLISGNSSLVALYEMLGYRLGKND